MSPRTDLACQQLVELVTDYLEGRLSRRDRKRFERHIAGCDGCRTYVEQMRLTLRAVGTLRTTNITGRARAELLDAFRDWNGA